MKKQKVISLILILFLIIEILSPIIPRGVFASENADNDGQTQVANEEQTGEEVSREYEIKEEETWDISENGDGSVIARWTLSDKTLRISGNGRMKDLGNMYDEKEDWYNTQYTNIIEKVIIEEGITNIGPDAFYKCNSLTSINIPEGVTEIGGGAFSGCSSLTDIEIPDGVTYIGNDAFYGCSSLTNIQIPEGLTYIGWGVFAGCSKLEAINVDTNNENYMSENGILFNKNKTEIIKYPSNKKDINEYKIPEKVESIEAYAFDECRNLTKIEVPEGITTIMPGTFEGCSSLTNIKIPEGVTNIGAFAFSGCSSLISINIPEGVTEIEDYAFYECSSLASINIPNGVTSIGWRSFYKCSSLISIEIPEGMTEIEREAFYGCSSLTNIEIPESVTCIGAIAFYECSKLIINVGADSVGHKYAEENKIGYILNGEANIISTEYEVKEEETWDISKNGDGSVIAKWSLENKTLNISGIGEMKYWKSSSKEDWHNTQYTNLIQTVVINEGITKIESYAFSECSNLTTIEIPKGVTSIENSVFSGCNSLTNIEIPKGVTSIENSVFSGCNSLTNIEIPESVTYIGEETFIECSKLEAINVDISNRNYISENGILFDKEKTEIICYPSEKKDIKKYVIPETVTSIESSAFSECSGLTNINIPGGVTNIGAFAFSGCSSLISINIPEGVTTIAKYTFYECSSLASINIPKSVMKIGYASFSGCSSLTSINIPEGVTSIGAFAFSRCSSLKNIIIKDTVTEIGTEAFSECSSLKNIIIKDAVTEIGSEAIDKGTIIYTKSNTKAHKYAEENKQGYIIDDEAPTFILTSNGNNNIQKAHNVKVLVTDNKEKVGVKNSSLKYQWTQSKERPTKESFIESFENNQTLTKNTGDGVLYLWIYAEDNLNNEKIVRSEAFYFDNTSPVLSTKYSTKEPTKENIIVTITENEEIQELEGWNLSTDKKQLTKEYVQNVEETITIKDIVGNAVKQTIKVDNIDKIAPKIEIKYSTKEQTRGKVKVEIVADEELQGIEGWILSSDKKILSREFAQNIQETVEIKDLAGNEAKQTITINNIDKTAPEVEVSYSTKEETEGSVTVEIQANEELQSLTGWNLSTDKKKLTKEYSRNTKETVTVKDIVGNEKQVEINIQNIKTPIKIGDINADDKIDITDIILLKRHLIAGNRINWILTGDNLELADMNENGKVDISDLLLLKREVAQNI